MQVYLIEPDAMERLTKLMNRLYNGNKMEYDERRDWAARLEFIIENAGKPVEWEE